MRPSSRTIPAAAVLTLAVIGCGDSSPPKDTAAARPDTPAEKTAGRVEVLQITYAGLDRAIKEQLGKVILVDVWSLT